MKEFRKFITAGFLLALLPAAAAAQQGAVVTGQVSSEAGAPIRGVTVFIQGTAVGTLTDVAGRYSLTVPASRITGQPATLTARRIGYTARSAQVTVTAEGLRQDFTLSVLASQLEGVVVTGLGIEREKRSVGTSIQSIGGEELTQARETNLVNSLAGKVSGVAITNSGSQGGSSRLVIRGANSIAGNNQPLFIVDGIPVSNQVVGAPAGFGGVDYGNAVQDLNSNDIENISVLKGPNAAALYGSRAANGAIVITTRSGKGTPRGFGVTASSNISFETPLRLPSYQNEYGQGSGGEFEYVDGAGGGINDGTDESWGPKFDGQPRPQFFGTGPWVAAPDNIKNFFETGRTLTNSVALSGTGEKANIRLSITNEDLEGMAPGMSLNKIATALNGGAELGERFSTTGTVQYIKNNGYNRNGTGYDNGNFMQQFVWFGRQVDVERLKNFKDADGNQINWNSNYHDNPYFIQLESQNRDQRDRIIGVGSVNFRPASWLNATVRSGTDWFRDYRKINRAFGLVETPQGGFSELNIFTQETNTEGLLTATKALGSRMSFNSSFGGNLRKTQYKSNSTNVDALVVPGTYNVGNAANTPLVAAYEENKKVNSLYGTAGVSFDNYLFVDVTGRNDWSSTLPEGENSYFYPSVSSSLVFTDAIPALSGRFLQYGKLRASVAKVGNDANPYQLQSVYTAVTPFNGAPRYAVPNSLANAGLKPEETKAFEVGAELSFLDNRLGLDVTYYNKATTNQILNAQISGATGYTSKALNAGKISNKGIEALVTMTPIRTSNGFTWSTAVNFAKNKSLVEELNADLQTVVLGSYWSLNVEARKGEKYGALYGNPYKRDAATGKIIVSASGRPVKDAQTRVLGHYTPDWTAGLSNSLSFKGVELSFLLDKHQGGDIFSVTNMFGRYSGVLEETLEGRETGIVVDGVLADGTPNTRNISAEAYNHSLYGIHEAHVFDASYLKLREMKLGYNMSSSLASRFRVQSVYMALVGRNLWLSTKTPHIDPETAFSSGNVQGLEHGQFPSQRSIGFNFSITP